MTRTYKPWSEEQILELISRKRAGEFTQDIAAAMGRPACSVSTRWSLVRQKMLERGLTPPTGGRGVGVRKHNGKEMRA